MPVNGRGNLVLNDLVLCRFELKERRIKGPRCLKGAQMTQITHGRAGHSYRGVLQGTAASHWKETELGACQRPTK